MTNRLASILCDIGAIMIVAALWMAWPPLAVGAVGAGLLALGLTSYRRPPQ